MEKLDVQHNYVIVRTLAAPEQVRPSGLLLPQGDGVVHPVTGQRRLNNRGVVVAVGPGTFAEPYTGERKPMSCKVGDSVLIRGSWIEVATNGELLALGEDYQIAAVVTEDGDAAKPLPPESEGQIIADGAPAN